MVGMKRVDVVASDQTLTVEAIREKAEWLKGQAEKNRELLKGDGPTEETEEVPKEDYGFACLAHEYMDRIDECVAEYSRLAADYIQFKQRVMSQWQQLESWVRATSSVVKGKDEDKECEEK